MKKTIISEINDIFEEYLRYNNKSLFYQTHQI